MQLTVLRAGELWLDGGAMFGIVPKTLWGKERMADDLNRIRLSMNVLLIDDGRQKWLVDTGAGAEWDEKTRRIYRLDPRPPDDYLADAGATPEQIDVVISSHLHFDHAGGHTRRAGQGETVASFPRASYVVQRAELEIAREVNERTRASYRAADFEPLAAEPGRLRIVDGETRLSRQVSVELAPGHTPGMQIVRVEAGGETVCFLADLVPTTSHVRYPYIMGYDLEPLRTLATKKRVLRRALDEGWTLVFEHDAERPVARLAEAGGKLTTMACGPVH
ncbi:MAG TPA: MBL fold metallo-hydrolase [Candidatus Polarisedimenticolaceae bacterium]|nr:MBL fold metallo-hydrolase [Candidatus Polarisedimenticolaceae bacterium]